MPVTSMSVRNLKDLASSRGTTLTAIGEKIGRKPSYMTLLNQGTPPKREGEIEMIATFLKCDAKLVKSAISSGRKWR